MWAPTWSNGYDASLSRCKKNQGSSHDISLGISLGESKKAQNAGDPGPIPGVGVFELTFVAAAPNMCVFVQKII